MTHHPKRLTRSRKQKIFGGVCAGIANYFNIDVTWVRLFTVLAFFLLSISSFLFIVAYIISWMVIPLETDDNYFYSGRYTTHD